MSDTVKQRNIDKLESTLASTTTTHSPVSDEAMRKAVCNVFDKDLNQVDLTVNTPRDDNDTDLDGNGIEMGNNNNNNNNNNNKQKMEDEGENNKEPKGTGCGCTII